MKRVFHNFGMPALRAKRIFVAVIVVICFVMVFAARYHHGYDAMKILADLAGFDLGPAQSRPRFSRQDISFQVHGRHQAADLYVPEGGAHAGLVLVPGAAADGRNDPRLVEFASTLTRAGFVVLVPGMPSLGQLQPSPGNTQEIGDAFSFLHAKKELVPSRWLGISAFSSASGPAVLAALDPAINRQVKFLLLIGGYHDLVRTLTYLTTGYFEVDGQLQYREPNTYGKWVYALGNARRLQNLSDRLALSEMARRKLESPAAPVDDLRAQLSTAGEAVYQFVTNADPVKAPELINGLPLALREDIAALDLAAHDLSGLKAKLILIHGRDDDIIPYTESISLAAALPHGQAHLYLLDGLHHVDRDFRGLDIWRAWLAMRNLLTRDGVGQLLE